MRVALLIASLVITFDLAAASPAEAQMKAEELEKTTEMFRLGFAFGLLHSLLYFSSSDPEQLAIANNVEAALKDCLARKELTPRIALAVIEGYIKNTPNERKDPLMRVAITALVNLCYK